jgi:hypothetical protein
LALHPEFLQVRDVQGVQHVINRWMIARVEIHGIEGPLRSARPNESALDETGINTATLRVEVICQAAGFVQLDGEQALAFLRVFSRGHHMYD